MKISNLVCFAGAALLVGASEPASAVRMSVYVRHAYQVMTGSTVSIGHVVSASTDFNRLTAGGTYEVRCNHPDMMLSTPGQRTASTSNLLGGLQMNVSVPYQLPAYVNMPGFHGLPRGTIVECQYVWTAEAVEGHYTIGTGGVGIIIGQGTARDGGVDDFRMQQPGTADGDDDACIP